MPEHPSPFRTPDGRTLVTRHVVAYVTRRHVNWVRREVPAVACDVLSRAALVDLDQAERVLEARQKRLPRRVT